MRPSSKVPAVQFSISLYPDVVGLLEERVAALRAIGLTNATKSSLIRVALEELDFGQLVERVRQAPPSVEGSPNAQEDEHARPAETAGGVDSDVERTHSDPLHIDTPDAVAGASGEVLFQLLTPEQRRSRRKREVRAKTVSTRRMTKRELELGRLLYPTPEHAEPRPATRGECEGGARPCPFVSCKHHLYLDVTQRTGAIKLNFPDLEVEHMTHSCTLDVADDGVNTLQRVGEIMNITRERVRQVEQKALDKGLRDICARAPDLAAEYAPAGEVKPRASTLHYNVRDARERALLERGLCRTCGDRPHRPRRTRCAECCKAATDAALRSRDRRRHLAVGVQPSAVIRSLGDEEGSR